MNDIKSLRKELTKVFMDLKSGEIEPKIASEMNNSAGKIINTLNVQLKYAEMRKSRTKIEFLECEEED